MTNQLIPQINQRFIEQARSTRKATEQARAHETDDPGYMSIVGAFLQIPKLRGYWPFTSINGNNDVVDLSGQDRTLTNNSAAAYDVDGIISYGIGDGVADYFSRPDEAGLSITGALSFGCWFYASDDLVGTKSIIGKNSAGSKSYLLHSESGQVLRATISVDGAAEKSVSSSYTVQQNTFAVVVYVPSTSLTIYVSSNGLMIPTTNTTSIPASIFDGTAAFTVLAQDPTTFFFGRASNAFLSAAALSPAFVRWLFKQTKWGYGA